MHSLMMAPVLDVMHSAWRGVASTIGQILNRGRQLVLGSKPEEAKTSSASLSLGTDELGSSWLLDFETGEVRLMPVEVPKTASPEGNVPLQMHELTSKALMAIFHDAGYGVEEFRRDAVTVVTEIGEVGVWLHMPEHMLGFWRTYGTPNWDMTDHEAHARTIEEINLEAIHTRFSLDREDGTVRAEYELPLMAGVSRAQILAALRAFVMSTKLRLLAHPELKIT